MIEKMDARLKKLLVDAILPSNTPIGVRDVLSQVDENAFLHITGLVDVPDIGEHFSVVRNGVSYQGTVSGVNYLEAHIVVRYLVPETLYFTTTENAKTYATTGDRGNYPNWSRSKDDEHQYPGEHDVRKQAYITFNEL